MLANSLQEKISNILPLTPSQGIQEPIVRLNPKTCNVALACHKLPFLFSINKKRGLLKILVSPFFHVFRINYSALSAGASAASTTASSALAAAFLPARRVLVFFLPAASFNKFSL